MKKIFSLFCCQKKIPVDKIILGIGNPGKKYFQTRHNIGFEIVDELAREYNATFDKEKFSSLVAFSNIKNLNVMLVKPLTFVNLSGVAAKKSLDYFRLKNTSLLVIVDDIHLPVGKIRMRHKGSSGGHNGLKSIIQNLETEQFSRLKIGIGNDKEQELAHYVLSKFPDEEQAVMKTSVISAKEKCKEWLCENVKES